MMQHWLKHKYYACGFSLTGFDLRIWERWERKSVMDFCAYGILFIGQWELAFKYSGKMTNKIPMNQIENENIVFKTWEWPRVNI